MVIWMIWFRLSVLNSILPEKRNDEMLCINYVIGKITYSVITQNTNDGK